VRTIVLLSALLAGCSAIGYHRLPGAEPVEPVPEDAPRALLVVVDGLRADVLADYLRILRESDDEPGWPSGLALLGREGLRLALAGRAEGPLPGFGLAADAALITGQFPDATGIPGSVFYESGPDGSLRRFDFSDAADAARIYFEPGFELPDATHRPLLEGLLRAPTLYERMPPGQSISVLHVLGRGAEWLVPERSGDGINAILQHEISAWAVPLFDRGVRNAAIDVALRKAPPRLMTLYFRGVSAGSCFQAERACQVDQPDLAAVQATQLKRVDEHLERVLKVLAGSRPDGLAHTTVLLVGTGGLVDRTRGTRPDGTRQLSPNAVTDHLAAMAPPECGAWLKTAAAQGDVVVAPNGALAQLYLRRAPAGQDADRAAHLDCLAQAIQSALTASPTPLAKDASARSDSTLAPAVDARSPRGHGPAPWLAGAVWLPGSALGSVMPRGSQAEVALAPAFADTLAPGRRSRILARLRRALDDGAYTRTGDVLLFAAAPWIFSDPLLVRPPAHAGGGGLEDAAGGTAFLVADAHLDDLAIKGLTTTAVELMDVAPTLLAVLRVPPEQQVGLPRPSLLAWQEDTLTWQAADRQVQPLPAPTGARMIWRETPEAVVVGLEEPASLWPPDHLGLRLGAQRFDWNPDAAAFAEGSPCTFQEADGRRRWQCTVPVDRTAPALTMAGVRRAPGGEPGDTPPAFSDFAVPVVLGPSTEPRIQRLEVVCADEEGVQIELTAEDTLGLDRLELVLATRHGAGTPDRMPAGLQAVATLGGLAPAAACRADPLDPTCEVTAVHGRWAGPVRVDFARRLMAHQRQAARLLSVQEGDLEGLLARFGATPADEPPRQAFLLARVCNVGGRCVERPLLSDRDYLARVESGCAPAQP